MSRIIDIDAPYQHPGDQPIAWVTVAQNDITGVIVKATEGAHLINPWLSRDVLQAKAVGIRVGAYHFARPAQNPPAVEAAWFLAQIAGLPLDLPHFLDLEDGSQLGWQQCADWAEEWFLHVADFAGPNGIFLNGNYLANLPLAPFGKRLAFMTPDEPAPVGTFMQRLPMTDVPGIAAPVDVNVLVGELPDVPGEPPVPAQQPTPDPVPPVAPSPTPEGESEVNLPILQQQEPPYTNHGYVVTLQTVLNAKGGANLAVDGEFGPQTDTKVRDFQQMHGLTIDGVVGAQTWTAALGS